MPGFDLAFVLGEGRLLVEITTPEPHSSDTWTEEKGDGYTSWSTDAKTEDAALRRLTGGFATKAEAIRKHCEAGAIAEGDYVVIAISGFRLSQEAPVAPKIGGPVPDFAKAFLPIGSQYVTFRVGADSDTPSVGGWQFKATIDQEGKNPVDRISSCDRNFSTFMPLPTRRCTLAGRSHRSRNARHFTIPWHGRRIRLSTFGWGVNTGLR
ncbi:hypothetical protein [Novosphingobium sp. Gsoil 351]|uniref:hypothetical protein n=1 Tax=Novosphingobium sp. Gsoil 351 TaxID=2675225 RepID=UPI0012B49674|nr:hypothetical protein [Novosphingobium sp. Gsoil 351]QGN54636.1 hypothetical protein GKE62_08785 [Novosphingobium sp. Gsoil 351]